MIPRAAVYALVLLLGSALWNWVPPLLLLTTGWRVDEATWMGHPPYSSDWILAGLITFLAGSSFLLFRNRKPQTNDAEVLLAAGFSILFLYLGYSLLIFQDYLFTRNGQAVPLDRVAWIFFGIGGFFLILLLKASKRGEWALGATLFFLLILAHFSISRFPLLGGFSNMILAMEAWGKTFLHGDSPYGAQVHSEQLMQCCYLPGLWLSFLPAVVLHMDLRFLTVIYTLLFVLMVWLSMRPQDRPLGSWFLVLFLLNPWTLARQEVYFSAYLLSWAAFFLALSRGRQTAAACCFGWGLSVHPFSWILLPVWAAWNIRCRGWRDARKDLLRAAGVAALVVLPFLLWDPQGFFQGAVLTWLGGNPIAVSHFGLATWLAPWPGLLKVLALIFLGTGVWGVWQGKDSLDSLFRWLTVSLGLVLLASYHIEHYYYFVPLALLLLHETALLRKVETP